MSFETTLLLSILLIISGMCIFSIVFIGLAAFFIIKASPTSRTNTGGGEILKGEDYLAAASLRPWNPNAWNDLSSHWDGWWWDITGFSGNKGYAHGIIASTQDPLGPGWMAFTNNRHELKNAEIVLKTSQQRVELKITSNSKWDQNIHASASIDGVENGSLEVTFPNCSYHSSDGTVTGAWNVKRRSSSGWYVLGQPVSQKKVLYDPIVVNGQPIANLTDRWFRTTKTKNTNPYPPAFQPVSPQLPHVEQNILLISIALGMYFDTMNYINNVTFNSRM